MPSFHGCFISKCVYKETFHLSLGGFRVVTLSHRSHTRGRGRYRSRLLGEIGTPTRLPFIRSYNLEPILEKTAEILKEVGG